MTAREISVQRGSGYIVARWGATWLDFIFMVIPASVIGAFVRDDNELGVIFGVAAIACVYYTLLEGLLGFTAGKWICQLRVVTESGMKPGLLKGLLRTLPRIIEVNPFLLGGVPAGLIVNFSKSHQRWGDYLAGTFVVRKKDLAELTSPEVAFQPAPVA